MMDRLGYLHPNDRWGGGNINSDAPTIYGTDGGSDTSDPDFDLLVEYNEPTTSTELDDLEADIAKRLQWFQKHGYVVDKLVEIWQGLSNEHRLMKSERAMEVDPVLPEDSLTATLNRERARVRLENEFKMLKNTLKKRREDLLYSGDSEQSILLLRQREIFYDAPRAPPAVQPPDADATAGHPVNWNPAYTLSIGPIRWGADLEGEIRALIDLLPTAYTGDKRTMAKRMQRKGFVAATFPSEEDAQKFWSSWKTTPPRGFEEVLVEPLDLRTVEEVAQGEEYSDEEEDEDDGEQDAEGAGLSADAYPHMAPGLEAGLV